MKGGLKEEREKSNTTIRTILTLEQSSYTDSISSDWRLIELNILALCLVAT